MFATTSLPAESSGLQRQNGVGEPCQVVGTTAVQRTEHELREPVVDVSLHERDQFVGSDGRDVIQVSVGSTGPKHGDGRRRYLGRAA